MSNSFIEGIAPLVFEFENKRFVKQNNFTDTAIKLLVLKSPVVYSFILKFFLEVDKSDAVMRNSGTSLKNIEKQVILFCKLIMSILLLQNHVFSCFIFILIIYPAISWLI